MSDDLKALIADYLQRYAAWPTHTKSRVLLRDCLKRIEELELDLAECNAVLNTISTFAEIARLRADLEAAESVIQKFARAGYAPALEWVQRKARTHDGWTPEPPF